MSEMHVTDAEFAILEVLWEAKEVTKRKIVERLYPHSGESGAATVQKLLQRLESKGFIVRDRSSFTHVIRPTQSKSAFVGKYLEQQARKLAGDSFASVLVQLIESKPLSDAEKQRIRELLDDSGSAD